MSGKILTLLLAVLLAGCVGKDVDYLVLKGEDHRISHWPSRLKVYRATEDSLAPLPGRAQLGIRLLPAG